MAILIVDDSAEMRRIIRGVLERAGHTDVITAASAAEAFKVLGIPRVTKSARHVELILMDVLMPDLDGISACGRIKGEERFQDTPVLMVTATAEEASLRDAFAAGASDYLQKPFKPLVLQARVEHALRLARETERRKQREEELLAMREELESANEALRRLADQDGLTGIGNRRSFEHSLDREWRRARRSKRPLSLIMADIDHFKYYNDTYGHPAGDECLKSVAAAFEQSLRRGGDRAFRYGGEEFAILLADTDLEGAVSVAEGLRSAVAALGMRHEASPVAPTVTVSVGVAAVYPARGGPDQALVDAADQALYRAKEEGRDALRYAAPAVAA